MKFRLDFEVSKAIKSGTSEFQRMMNIVHLEGVLSGLGRAKESYKNTNLYYKYDTLISKYNTQLSNLTQSQTPELLLCEMLKVVE